MPDPVPFIIIPIVAPAVISLLVVLVAWRPWRRGHVGGQWGAPLALVVGFVPMYRYVAETWPPFPAAAADGWIFYAAILAGIVAVLGGVLNLPVWVRIVPAALVLLAAYVAVLKIPLGNEPTRNKALIGIIGATIGGVMWWLAFQRNSQPSDRVIGLCAAALLTIFAAAVLMMSGSTKYGRLALALGGATGPVALLGLITRNASIGRAALVLTTVLGGLLLASGFFTFSEQGPYALLLVAVAPVLLMIAPLLHRARRPLIVVLLSLLVFSIPLLVATALTLPGFIQQISADENEYY